MTELFTKDEARRMVCPLLSRAATEPCLANDCMAWCWRDDEIEERYTHANSSDAVAPPGGDGWVLKTGPWRDPEERADSNRAFGATWERVRPGRRGYCGAFVKVSP